MIHPPMMMATTMVTITASPSDSNWLLTGRLRLASKMRAQTSLIHTSPLKSPSTKMIWSGATIGAVPDTIAGTIISPSVSTSVVSLVI